MTLHKYSRRSNTVIPPPPSDLLPLIYDELRALAAAKMADESPDNTLQATALVHEAYIRLVDVDQAQHWNSRGHFFRAAAEAMRRILVESARRKAVDSGVLVHSSDANLASDDLVTISDRSMKFWISMRL